MRPVRLCFFLQLLFFFLLTCFMTNAAEAEASDFSPYKRREPYVAEPYVPPPPPESTVHLKDMGDGTLLDLDSGLMWTQKDSYSDLGHCLNWFQSVDYVEKLETGGYSDWRLPTQRELYGIYDPTKENILAWDEDPENPLHLDEKFAPGAAYWVWTSKHYDTELSECCAVAFYIVKGFFNIRRYTMCANGGVRAVRRAQ